MNDRQKNEGIENGDIFVGHNSNPSAVAGAIAGVIRTGKRVRLKTASHSGVVRAVNAIILAQSFLNDPNFPGNKGRVRLNMTVFRDRQKPYGTVFVVHPRYLQERENDSESCGWGGEN